MSAIEELKLIQAQESALRELNRYTYVTKQTPLYDFTRDEALSALRYIAEKNECLPEFNELVARTYSDTLSMLYVIISAIDKETDPFQKEKAIAALDLVNFDKSKNKEL